LASGGPKEGSSKIEDMSSSIRPGLVSITYRALSPSEIVWLAREANLEGIEWGGDVHVPTVTTAREVRTLTEDAGLAVAAYGSYWRARGDFEEVAEIAATLGAPTIRVWGGDKGTKDSDQTHRAQVVNALHQACEIASQNGQTVSLEFHAGTLTDTLDSTLRLVQEVGHPALRLYWQPAPNRPHAERQEELKAVLPQLTNLHVFQWTKPEASVLRHALEEGAAEWPDYLKAANGDRFALLEFVPNDDPDLLNREAATLRRWLT